MPAEELRRSRKRLRTGRRARGRYLVDRRVLPERQVPEAAADLVSALADCEQGREGKSTGMRHGHTLSFRGAPCYPRASSPCTTTDCVMPQRNRPGPAAAAPSSNVPAQPPSRQGRGYRSHVAAASRCPRKGTSGSGLALSASVSLSP